MAARNPGTRMKKVMTNPARMRQWVDIRSNQEIPGSPGLWVQLRLRYWHLEFPEVPSEHGSPPAPIVFSRNSHYT